MLKARGARETAHSQTAGLREDLQKIKCLSGVLKEPKELAREREGRRGKRNGNSRARPRLCQDASGRAEAHGRREGPGGRQERHP